MNLALVVLYVQFAKSDAALRSRAAAAAKARAKAQRRASRGELGSGSLGGGAADPDVSHGGSTTSSDSEGEGGAEDGVEGKDGKAPRGKEAEGQQQEGKEGGGELKGWVCRLAGGGRVAPSQSSVTQGAHGGGGLRAGGVYGSMYGGGVSMYGGRSHMHGGRQGCWRHTHALLHAAARSRWLQVLTLAAILVNTVIMCINW